MADVKVIVAEIDGTDLDDLEERLLSAEDTKFDNTSNGFTTTDVQSAIEEADTLTIQKTGAQIATSVDTVNFQTGAFDVTDDGGKKVTVSIPQVFGDLEEDRLVYVKCFDGTDCYGTVELLVDHTLNFITKVEC